MKSDIRLFLFCLIGAGVAQGAITWKPFELPPACVGMPYKFDISRFASDPEGDTMIFSKTSGPAWLSLLSYGLLNGTPQKTDVGVSSFNVAASDGDSGAFTTVKVAVKECGNLPAPLTCESGKNAHFVGKSSGGDLIYSCPVTND